MGLFLAVSAYRTQEIPQLYQAITATLAEKGVRSDAVRDSARKDDAHVQACLFPPRNGWTVVQWPVFFGLHDVPMSAALSRTLSCLASTVHIYDGAYWVHTLIEKGEVTDRFCARPDYFGQDPGTISSLRRRYRGDPERITRLVGTASVKRVAPYLVHLENNSTGKGHPDDEYPLDDPWIFTDFWRCLGISYPGAKNHPALRLELEPKYSDKLPMDDEPQAL